MKMTFECRPDIRPDKPWKYTIKIDDVYEVGFCESFSECLKECERFTAANTVFLYDDLAELLQSEPRVYSS